MAVETSFEKDIAEALSKCTPMLDGNDREFCARVWRASSKLYEDRVQAIGFSGMDAVLDAGCGMGQWTFALAKLNRWVFAVDSEDSRVSTTACMMESLRAENVQVQRSSIEELPLDSGSMNAVFCYSVIMMTDHERVLDEFFRVLRPGGKLYVCANGLGYYLGNIASPRNASASYDPRGMAISAIQNTLDWLMLGEKRLGQRLLPGRYLEAVACRRGFRPIALQAEGTFHHVGTPPPTAFFPRDAFGLENVYELLCEKPLR